MGGRALGTLPTDVALKFHETSPLSFVAVHPAGVGTYVSRSFPPAQKRVNAVASNRGITDEAISP